MSGSVARPKSTAKSQYVDSLMMTAPTLDHLADLLGKVSSVCGWTAWAIRPVPQAGCSEPDADMLAEAEEALFNAYSAIYAMRGEPRQ